MTSCEPADTANLSTQRILNYLRSPISGTIRLSSECRPSQVIGKRASVREVQEASTPKSSPILFFSRTRISATLLVLPTTVYTRQNQALAPFFQRFIVKLWLFELSSRVTFASVSGRWQNEFSLNHTNGRIGRNPDGKAMNANSELPRDSGPTGLAVRNSRQYQVRPRSKWPTAFRAPATRRPAPLDCLRFHSAPVASNSASRPIAARKWTEPQCLRWRRRRNHGSNRRASDRRGGRQASMDVVGSVRQQP